MYAFIQQQEAQFSNNDSSASFTTPNKITMKPLHYTTQIAFAMAIPPSLVSASCGFSADTDTSLPTGLFSSSFHPPTPPTISTEHASSFIQHKYDTNVSHITSGYWYNSATAGKVRVDEAYAGAVASSLFDYTDVDQTGAVKNHLWLLEGSFGSAPSCFNAYVSLPGFPLLTGDLLASSNASFGGVVDDPWVGRAESVSSETVPRFVITR